MMRIVTGDEIRIETGKNSAETHIFINDVEMRGVQSITWHIDVETRIPLLTMEVRDNFGAIKEVRAFLVEGNDMLDFEKWLTERGR